MTPQPAPESPLENLQFEKAEFADNRPQCALCKSVIGSTYFHVAGQTACPTCAELARAGQDRPKNEWVLRGALYGLGTAVACSIGYAVITIVTGLELAIVSILVGYLVGTAVRKGSGGLGGRRCQGIAVTLTYLAITMSYVPLIINEARKKEPTKVTATATKDQKAVVEEEEAGPALTVSGFVVALGVLAGISLFAPFFGLTQGFGGIIGLLIIFFGLSRAWRLTARDDRLVMGPYTVEGAGAGG